MNIGKAIKTIRKDYEMNQAEFAKKIGVTQAYLSLLESNKKTPSVDTLISISKELNTPLPILFWFSLDKSDVKPYKHDIYDALKPSVDSLIMKIF